MNEEGATLPIKQGGMFRCCIQHLCETKPESEEDGATTRCPYCSATLRVVDGAWEWANEETEE